LGYGCKCKQCWSFWKKRLNESPMEQEDLMKQPN
jgi:hypothetical protein